MRTVAASLALIAALGAGPAAAKVAQVSDGGFVVQLAAEVEVGRQAAWDELLKPQDWWDPAHSFSGDAANFSLDPRPGGCFCEAMPGKDGTPDGGVEHMQVIYVEPYRALRMRGALGPLQSEALVGNLTIQLKPVDGGGTQVLWEYVVGGFMRPKAEEVAPAVDKVLSEQLARLAAKLGGVQPVDESARVGGKRSAPPKKVIIGR